jgi:hypothetical protein
VKTLGAAALAALAIGASAAPPAGAQTPATTAAAAPKAAPKVQPEALRALEGMSAYLATLKSFRVTSQTSLDVVTVEGQRVQLDGVVTYKVRRPDRFIIDFSTALKKRRYVYDGKTFVLFAPELGYYARVPAPPTNTQTLDLLWDKFGIVLPLEDLFRWNAADNRRSREKLVSGFDVGPAIVDGVATEQYAFREGELDWQVWIKNGSQPLPVKVMIVSHKDPANPAYIARLAWVLNPVFTDAEFDFRPGPTLKPIRLTSAKP